jgi:hypothetical protein
MEYELTRDNSKEAGNGKEFVGTKQRSWLSVGEKGN